MWIRGCPACLVMRWRESRVQYRLIRLPIFPSSHPPRYPPGKTTSHPAGLKEFGGVTGEGGYGDFGLRG